jgi:flagellar hook protein FlgE
MMRWGVLGLGALLLAGSPAGCSGHVLASPIPCDESGRGPGAGGMPASSADGSSDGSNDEQSPDAESGIDAVGVSSPDVGATPTCTGPTATTRISVVANLSAVSVPPPAPWDAQDPDSTSNFSFGVVIFDGAGSPHDGLLFFVNTGSNAWEYHLVAGGSEVEGGTQGANLEISNGMLAFTTAGALQKTTSNASSFAFNGAPYQSVSVIFSMTQFADYSALQGLSQNGYATCPTAAPSVDDAAEAGCLGPRPTTLIRFAAPLDASTPRPASSFDPQNAPATSDSGAPVVVNDSLGDLHLVYIYFVHRAAQSWNYHLLADGVDVAGGVPGQKWEFGSGLLAFDRSGALLSTSSTGGTVTFNGAQEQTIGLSFEAPTAVGGTGLDGTTEVAETDSFWFQAVISQDGRPACSLAEPSIDAAADYATMLHPSCTTPLATRTLTIVANLDPNATPPAETWDPQNPNTTSNFSTSMTIMDSLGVGHQVSVYFVNVAPYAWQYHALANGAEVQGQIPTQNVEFAAGSLGFNTNGALQSSSSTGGSIVFIGAQPLMLDLKMGTAIDTGGTGLDGSTSFGNASDVSMQSEDGTDECVRP